MKELLTDESYSGFQMWLVANPTAGAVITETGGLRKVRWASEGGGKSGGVRVIYFYASQQEPLRMLLIYRKGVQDSLTAAQKKMLRAFNEDW